jgi:hypothetical protein
LLLDPLGSGTRFRHVTYVRNSTTVTALPPRSSASNDCLATNG